MRELLAAQRRAEDETGRVHDLNYYILIGEMEVEGHLSCESYGVKVAAGEGEAAEVPNITVNIARIDALMDLLARNAVSPAGLRDVVEDWL